MQEGAAGAAVPGTTAVAENAVAVGESRSRSRSRSRLRARSRSLLGSVAALWFSGEDNACLLAVTVLRVLHLVASGAFIFFRGGKIVFWLKLFWGALFTKVICTFLKSVRKDGFFDAPFELFKEKKSFHLLEGTMNFLRAEKGQKWKKPLKISKNGFL